MTEILAVDVLVENHVTVLEKVYTSKP